MDIDEKDAMLIGHLGRDETKNDEDGYEIPVFGTEAVPNRDRQAVWMMAAPWPRENSRAVSGGASTDAVTDKSGNPLNGETIEGITGAKL